MHRNPNVALGEAVILRIGRVKSGCSKGVSINGTFLDTRALFILPRKKLSVLGTSYCKP